MSIEAMTSKQESELVDSVMEAIGFANEGAHPNDAIAKVAANHGYNQNFVRRMVEAFNVSKSLKHQKEASGEAKADSFAIADPDVIIKQIWPESVETPVEKKSAEWEPAGTNMEEKRFFSLDSQPTLDNNPEEHSWDKQSFDILLKRAYNELYRRERIVEEMRHKMASARMSLLDKVNKFAAYFRSTVHEPFERVERAALQHWGEPVRPLMNAAWEMSKGASFGEKRAEAATPVKYEDKEPYALLSNVMDQRDAYLTALRDFSKESSSTKEYRDALEMRRRIFTKLGAGGPLAPFFGGTLGSLVKALPKSTVAEEFPSAAAATLPPDYEAERKLIQAQMMLNDFLTTDEVLSKAEPGRVVNTYNEIAAIAPRMAESPAMMRGVLRKAVESDILDPYELANLVTTEVGLKKEREPLAPMAMPGAPAAAGA